MDDDLILFQDLVDIDHINRRRVIITRQYVDHLDLPDYAFKERYRMTKESFKLLVDMIKERYPEPAKDVRGRKRIRIEDRVMITLRYFATNSFQLCVADTIGFSQSTVSVIIKEMSFKIASFYKDFITWPEYKEISKGFICMMSNRYYNRLPFPGVIGCIDGTLVKILAKGVHEREGFRDRKGSISLNIQVICDHRLLFTNVVAQWTGNTHDARIWGECSLSKKFENGELKGLLLGDSGYPLKPYLMIPLSSPKGQAEENYNFAHIQTRNCIERAIGVAKKRFPILASTIRLNLDTAKNAIIACFVLHNFLKKNGDELEEEHDLTSSGVMVTLEERLIRETSESIQRCVRGESVRRLLIEQHFTR